MINAPAWYNISNNFAKQSPICTLARVMFNGQIAVRMSASQRRQRSKPQHNGVNAISSQESTVHTITYIHNKTTHAIDGNRALFWLFLFACLLALYCFRYTLHTNIGTNAVQCRFNHAPIHITFTQHITVFLFRGLLTLSILCHILCFLLAPFFTIFSKKLLFFNVLSHIITKTEILKDTNFDSTATITKAVPIQKHGCKNGGNWFHPVAPFSATVPPVGKASNLFWVFG